MSAAPTDHVAAGLKLLMAGDLPAAAKKFEAALQRDPNQPDALHLLGIVAFQTGQHAQALTLIQNALKLRPAFADAESNLSSVYMAMKAWEDAEAAVRRAIALNDKPAAYHFNLGNALAAQKKLKDAAAAYTAAVTRQPVYPEALSNLGTVYRDLEDLGAATQCYEKAVQQRPSYAEAVYNLANAYRDAGRLSEAEVAIRTAISLDPKNPKAHNTLGNILSESARSDSALAAFEAAARLDPTSLPMASNILSCMQYIVGVNDQKLQAAHAHWCGAFNDLFTAPKHGPVDKNPDRTLNVGFVSPDMGQHPCGILSVRLFEHLNHAEIKPIIFSTRRLAREDEISDRIARVSDWRRVEALSDADMADEIARQNVDILIDMSGHTSGHRLGVFARKPAPLQMSWIGYVGSTGLPTMDAIIADRWHAPLGQEPAGPEKFIRLADGYTCFDPPDDMGEVAPLPAQSKGYVTFGSLNNATKLNPDVIKSYAAIMRGVENSRLILAFRGLSDPGVQKFLRDLFAVHGIDAARVDIRGYAKRPKFLAIYNEIDLALDTFPYSGGLTTCEALWMGVPVVTFTGQTFAGRHSTSYMNNVGLGDFVAADRAAFEHLAISKARDLEALADVRTGLRARMTASPVCNGPRFAAAFTTAMRDAWRATCAASR